jgi:hypothetical protein
MTPPIPPAHRNAPPGTSGVAADRIARCAAKQRADVLAVIVKAGAFGATPRGRPAAVWVTPNHAPKTKEGAA